MEYDIFMVLIGISLISVFSFSFGKHVAEYDLTKDWNGGDWASFRSYKRLRKNPHLTVFSYCNEQLKTLNTTVSEIKYAKIANSKVVLKNSQNEEIVDILYK